jgi:Fuc2NAc and GlcNAc transferase
VYQPFIIFLAIFGGTFSGVELFRRWSLKRKLLDIPNERSSHTIPTPRGGGLIICAVSMLAFFLYELLKFDAFNAAYFAGALIVAAISLIDDVRSVSPFWRILCHSLAAGLAVRSFSGFENIWIPFHGAVQIGFWGDLAAFFWIVWLINAYNFMDGIDGIAATQAITAGVGWSFFGIVLGIDNAFYYGGVLAASAMGFLMLNWQPAKIFMGDVGSAFLGYTFAVLPLLVSKESKNLEIDPFLPWLGVLLVWFFVFDSVFTFFRRLVRGEKVWQPHRRHIYQNLVISGVSHAKVTLLYGAVSAILVFTVIWFSTSSQKLLPLTGAVAAAETIFLVIVWRSVCGQKTDNFEK